MTRHLLPQVQMAGMERIWFLTNQNLGRSRCHSFNRALPCARPFRLLTITTVHITWLELNSRNFPPPPLLPACALIIYFV